jgi:hypothetical protein
LSSKLVVDDWHVGAGEEHPRRGAARHELAVMEHPQLLLRHAGRQLGRVEPEREPIHDGRPESDFNPETRRLATTRAGRPEPENQAAAATAWTASGAGPRARG